MVRVRNLVLAIAAATALTSEMAYALGLGEVRLQSALNQPLVAEIELLDSSSLAAGEVIPSLASVEEFNKAGVDRQYFLTDLKFTPVLRPNGKSVIQVTSSKPVREPYLNFLVEILWPNGRLLREYTLLLDPPLYSPETAAAAAPQLPIASQAPRQTSSRPASPAPAPRAAAPSTSGSTAPAGLQGDEYRTSARDTLWDIAERTRKGGTVHQAMLAIQDLNPDAFIDGNINRMKSGQVLRLPNAEQVGSRNQAEAIAQVAEQNAAWRQGRSIAAPGRQLDATQRSTAGAAPSRSETGDNLRLVAPESGASTSGSDRGTGADAKALSDKLAVTQESLDSSRRENADLQGRLGDLQGQLEKLQRLMQLKDDQLAKLQAQLAAEGAAANPPQNAGQYEAGTPSTAAPPGASSDATPPGTDDGADSSDMAAPADPAGAAMSGTESSVPPVAQAPAAKPAPQPAPAPAPAAQQQPEPGILDNPMMLGIIGGGALLLLLVGLMALSRRNAMKEAELQDSFAEDERSNFYASEQAFPSGGFDSVNDHAAQKDAAPVALASEQVTAQTGDALGEADIYIAYGRFNQAAELLQNALNDEPHRSELRLKLMEVYAELGDRDGFAREEAELREIGGANAGIEQLKSKYPTMGLVAPAAAAGYAAAAYQQNDSLNLDDLELDEPVAESNSTLDTDEFALDLDELDLADEPAQHESSAARTSDELVLNRETDLSSSVPSDEDDFSFDLGLDDETKPAAASKDAGSDFSFDLEDEPKSTESTAGDDFLLSLDDDLSEAPQSGKSADEFSFDLPQAESSAELPDDFDLSLDDELATETASQEDFAVQLDEVDAELEALSQGIDESRDDAAGLSPAAPAAGMDDLGEDFDFLSGTDETSTKLDLARAYIDMGDAEGARDILDEVIGEGNDSQQQEAREMLARLA
ncbi:FimV/HubP family polar landmark protein [Stutzerimonas azotifigens]|uniref:FimV family protein n=1 Tax=Stutzerimonas azotifigens TaxID=291995 RepID=A0ABR5Z2W8_9GAMM|nr:FimV/HubP family polar landmark protein [Stutzerimonas azotifigens]MBA1274558.1 FimV family protein [Stutzerimonas azotifigens]